MQNIKEAIVEEIESIYYSYQDIFELLVFIVAFAVTAVVLIGAYSLTGSAIATAAICIIAVVAILYKRYW